MPPRRSAGHTRHARRRGETLRDALRVLALLREQRGWRVEELTGELRIHRRTLYRILGAIEAAGLPLEVLREGTERYYRVPVEWLREWLDL